MNSTGKRTIELLMGPVVFNLLADSRFLEGWSRLCNVCPWATAFQSPAFVNTWYCVYKSAFLPILVKGECAGKLTGLITLAKDKDGLITGAGTNQAEYQVWLTEEVNDDTFIRKALLELRRFFPVNKIVLKYIPAGVSMDFIKNDPGWNNRCFVKTSPQPLMIINDAHLTNELKKKNRREKVNRLKRLGPLKFERISDYASFVSVFDELALQSDFRKGAMYNKVVFKTDPLRKEFLLALFEQNHLHATVLKLNDKIIASNVSVWGNNRVHLQGINSFAAAYSRYSPGIIHFLMLGKLLSEEGVAVFDLTPGADAYKETLATDYSEAYTLSIGNDYYGLTCRLQFWFNSVLKKTATFVGIKRDTLKNGRNSLALRKEKLRKLARQDVASLFSFFLSRLKRKRKNTKCWVVQKTFPVSGLLPVQKDDLNDLLSFDQREIRYSPKEFLTNAMHRFEEGAHCYSWVEKGLLMGCAWVANPPPSDAAFKNDGKTEGSFTSLTDLYCHPKIRKEFPLFLRSVAKELSFDNPHDKFYLITDCDDDGAFEKAGFRQLPA